MRYRYLPLLLAGACLAAHAAEENACVEVEISGRTEQSISCLGKKLMAPESAAARRSPPPSAAEEIAQRPSNQLGLYNRAAMEHRMGNNFGKSLTPQRPAAALPASPLVRGRE